MRHLPRILTAFCLSLLLLTTACGDPDNEENLSACAGNLRQLSSVLDMWAMDHQGQYPERLEELVSHYVKDEKLLICPSAGVNTYFAGYKRIPGVGGSPDTYVLSCHGANHRNQDVPPDFPQFGSDGALKMQ